MTSQTKALTPAHAQPSASSSPNRARCAARSSRLRALLRHRPPSSSARRPEPCGGRRFSLRSGSRSCSGGRCTGTCRSPAASAATGSPASATPGKISPWKTIAAGGVLDLDVVRDAGVLVVELDREARVGRGRRRSAWSNAMLDARRRSADRSRRAIRPAARRAGLAEPRHRTRRRAGRGGELVRPAGRERRRRRAPARSSGRPSRVNVSTSPVTGSISGSSSSSSRTMYVSVVRARG